MVCLERVAFLFARARWVSGSSDFATRLGV
jgi:hypothetical protein